MNGPVSGRYREITFGRTKCNRTHACRKVNPFNGSGRDTPEHEDRFFPVATPSEQIGVTRTEAKLRSLCLVLECTGWQGTIGGAAERENARAIHRAYPTPIVAD